MFSKTLPIKEEIQMKFLLDVTAEPEGIASTTNITSEIIYPNKEEDEGIT